MKSLPENPCFDTFTNPPPPELFEKSKTDPLGLYGTRILLHILEADINPNLNDYQYERTPAPWEQNNILFDTSLSRFKKKIRRVKQFFAKEYQQLRERYSSYFDAYIDLDGSKCEQKVAAATFYPKDPENSGAVRLRDGSFVFNAELDLGGRFYTPSSKEIFNFDKN